MPKLKLTLDEFRASGRASDDLGRDLNAAYWEDHKVPARGRIYLGSLFIEERQVAGWPNGVNPRWYLITDGQGENLSDDLPRLEALLYEFAVGEGYFEPV